MPRDTYSGYGRKGCQISRDHIEWLRNLPVEEVGPFIVQRADDASWFVSDRQGVCVMDEWLGRSMEMHVALFVCEALNTRVSVSPVMGGSRSLDDPRKQIDPVYRYDWRYKGKII